MTTSLRAEIRRRSPLTFAEFMRLCLYHPEHGYYATSVPGRGGNYLTAPSLSPVFGQCVGRALEDMWTALGRPRPFTVAEVGPGDGSLAAAALAAAQVPALRWVLVEPHAYARRVQAQRLAQFTVVRWAPDVPEDTHCVLANEVLDNFPVHMVFRQGGVLQEAFVVAGSHLVLGPVSDPRITTWVDSYVPHDMEGWIKVALHSQDWLRRMAAPYVLILDYGDQADLLYQRRPNGTLEFWRDGPIDGPFDALGKCDISAHVNFSALAAASGDRTPTSADLADQREFLLAYGLRETLDDLARRTNDTAGIAHLLHVSERNDAALLAARNGMGHFKVLLRSRGVPRPGKWPHHRND